MALIHIQRVLDRLSQIKEDSPDEKIAYFLQWYPVETLGPGKRAGLWVTGCHKVCYGCAAEETQFPKAGQYYVETVESLTEIISSKTTSLDGLTISGGEPLLQARPLTKLVENLKSKYSDMTVMIYTGFRMEELYNGFNIEEFNLAEDKVNYLGQLIKMPANELIGAHDFLSMCDLVIDGPYIAKKNDGIGLRGSSNQRFLHFTGNLISYDLESAERTRQDTGWAKGPGFGAEKYTIGIPPGGLI